MPRWISAALNLEIDPLSVRSRALTASKTWTRADNRRESSYALAQRRGEVLRGLFPKLASWLESAAQRARRNEIEQYLSQATDIADLERRIRRLERRSTDSLFH
jgi:hypothetical protein